MKELRFSFFFISSVVLIALDQLSKLWIVNHIPLGTFQKGLLGLFSLTYLRNYGAAFSILQNQQWLFAVMTVVIVGFAFYYFVKHIEGSFWFLLALTLIISGGIGNFIDRFRLGYVVDMVHLDVINFAVFNMADSYLTVGVILLLIVLWRGEKYGDNH